LKVKRAKNCSPKQRSRLITCECGYRFLLVLDLTTMAQVIENHVLEHKKQDALSEEETEDIRDALIAQVFELAAELES